MIAPPERVPFARRGRDGDYVRDTAGLWADIPSFTAFAQEVHDALLADELLFAQRQRLMRRAEELGIRPFDANLIIAMVQNRMEASVSKARKNRGANSQLTTILTFAIVQSLIVVSLWWVLR